MRIDKAGISGTQLTLTIFCFLQASALLTSFLSAVTLHDSWIAASAAALIFIPILLIYRDLMVMFPDRNLLQMLDKVFGPVAGGILGVLYMWFFFTLSALNLSDMSEFTKLTFMRDTPGVALAVICILVSAIAVRNGLGLVTRYSALFAAASTLILIVSVLLLTNQVHLPNFLPMFGLPLKKYIQGTHISLTIPYGELVVFLMITPNCGLPRRGLTKCLFAGFALGAFVYIAMLLRDIGVLGDTIEMFTLPSLEALRLVNLGPALSRMEILFATVLVILLFMKITFLYYVCVIGTAQIFKVKNYRRLALAAGALIIAYGRTLYASGVEHAASGRKIVPVLWTLFEIMIPLLTLVAARLRNLFRPEGTQP